MRIGNTNYIIEYTNRIRESKEKECVARLIPPLSLGENGKIILKKGKNPKEERKNLFHEITHAIFCELFTTCPKYKRKINQLYKDEIFIQRVSEILNQIFNLKENAKKMPLV